MSTLGIIFSNIQDKGTFEVTKYRTIASIPIGGRYRLIDFALSNMVNNNISHIGVLTKNNYQSLMDHIGSGKEWDLARKNGGLVILPPYGVKNDMSYTGRLEALKSIIGFISKAPEEYVILTDCYHICNLDYKEMFKKHFESHADITCMYIEKDVIANDYMPISTFTLDDNSRITEVKVRRNFFGKANVSTDTWIMKKQLLLDLVLDAINNDLISFNKDILKEGVKRLKIYGYKFDGYFGNIGSMMSYYKLNMSLLNKDVRDELFNQEGRAIYTKVRDSFPTKYGSEANVKNSLIADGCIIDGVVENSILFRGVKIEKGSVIKNSILMQDTFVNEGVNLNYVITDKNVKIISKKKITGSEEYPVYVKKDGVI